MSVTETTTCLNLAENPAHILAIETYNSARERNTIDEKVFMSLIQWEARLHEARSYLALAKVELENHGLGPYLPAIIIFQWGFLRDRGFAPKIIRGYMSYDIDKKDSSKEQEKMQKPDFVVPTLWIEIEQPSTLVPILQNIWGELHPRASPKLMCDLSGVTAWLREGIVLGQVLRPGIDLETHIRYWRTKVADFPEEKHKLCIAQEQNWDFIATYPEKYFKFGMEDQLRKQVLQVARRVEYGDPGKVQYFDHQTM